MKTFQKRLLSAALVLSMLLTGVCSMAAEPKKREYAQKIFSSQSIEDGITTNWNNYAVATRDGREGWKMGVEANYYNIWMDIDDDFMYNLPPDTPVDVTVEYFDEGHGWFTLLYDSDQSISEFGNDPNYQWFCGAEQVNLTDTCEWKSYTFHLDDLTAATRPWGLVDLNLTLTDSYRFGTSQEDVLIGAVRVEYGVLENPLKMDINMGTAGNILSDEDELALTFDMRNRDNEDVSVKVNCDVYDSLGRCIETIPQQKFSVTALEKKAEKIPIKNPKTYGLYQIRGKMEIDYKSQNKTITKEFTEKFSLSVKMTENEQSDIYGTCHQIMAYGMGSPEDVGSVLNNVGARYIRDNIIYAEKIDGKWRVPDKLVEGWKSLHDQGITIVGILMGVKNGIARNDSEVEDYAQYCGDVAEQLKGIINVFEFMNETSSPNSAVGEPSIEWYTKMMKAAYPRIKKAQPESTCLGFVVGGYANNAIDFDYIEQGLELGAYPYMDGISVHPYNWGSFKEIELMEESKKLKELMSKYGEVKPIWVTEYGFSTFQGNGAYTRREQYQNLILSRAVMSGYNLFDKYIEYCLCNRPSITDYESNWGLLEYYYDKESPFAAKESYIAMAAYNRFVNKNTEIKDVLGADSIYTFHYYNNALAKDILLVQSNVLEPAHKAYRLGCSSVDLYDAFGNKQGTLYSDSGVYNFTVSKEPLYAVGNFTEFSETDYAPVAVASQSEFTVSGNDEFTYSIIKKTDKHLTLKISGDVDVVENKGFIDDEAHIRLKVPDLVGKTVSFYVSAEDEEGKSYFSEKYMIELVAPLSVEVEAEPATELNNNIWQIKATLKNTCETQKISGTFKINAPENLAGMYPEKEFKDLRALDEIIFLFPLPEKVNKNTIDLAYSVELDGGYSIEGEKKLDFTTAVYAEKKPVIDGIVSDNEWTGSWYGAEDVKDVVYIPRWAGPEDLSFNGTLMWDEDNAYILCVVNDDVHYVNYNSPDAMWSTDGIQFAFDDKEFINPAELSRYTELGMAASPSGGAAVYRWSSYYGLPVGVVEDCDIAVKRYDTYTVYECRIPWSEVFHEGFKFSPETFCRFSIMANDHDGDADGRGWIEYMSGIGYTKDITLFGIINVKK